MVDRVPCEVNEKLILLQLLYYLRLGNLSFLLKAKKQINLLKRSDLVVMVVEWIDR